ncbi:MAG: hypothetical protein ABSA11_17450 [Candidatus Bathyarchaeia archaeon]
MRRKKKDVTNTANFYSTPGTYEYHEHHKTKPLKSNTHDDKWDSSSFLVKKRKKR